MATATDSTRPAARNQGIDCIELVVGYACNCACSPCPTAHMAPAQRSATLSSRQMASALAMGRASGATSVWFSGGEPTLHPALTAAVALARRIGYSGVRIQTNGMRLAYPEYARALAEAGADCVSLSVMGPDARTHDAVTLRPQSFELLESAARNLAALGIRTEADVLITTENAGALSAIVERFAGLGVEAFTFWLVSLHGLDFETNAFRVPALRAIRPALQSAFDRAGALGVAATSLHTPFCALDPPFRDRYVHAGRYRLLVVAPRSAPFPAERSPMEGGVYLDQCALCSCRPDCLGLREDYLRLHGAGEFNAIRPVDR